MDPSVLVRIDRAIADNLRDIERSFGSQSGIVQDFIIFISAKLKTDLFGYTRFTLQEFCTATGRRRQELAVIHSDFLSGVKKAPIIEGYAFNTVMDFALYCMLEKNIIFSSRYEVKGNGQVIQMHNFPILKDLKLNFDRKSKEQKVYDVRLSDELLNGFLYRYYTVNAESYKLVGKGRGGEGRKRLLLYLSKLNHVLLSVNTSGNTSIPLDRLCYLANINDPKPYHKKQNLSRVLDFIQKDGKFPFKYDYLHSEGKEGYMVNLRFPERSNKQLLLKEHNFYCRLLEGLYTVFNKQVIKEQLITDKDPFQCWLANANLDTALKAQILVNAYYAAFHKNISPALAANLIRSGSFLRALTDVR